MESIVVQILIPVATLVAGYFGEKATRKLNWFKAKKEVESSKIIDMEASLKFWVENSNQMREELTEVHQKFELRDTEFRSKIDQLQGEKETLSGLIQDLKVERDEFKLLNQKLILTIEELENFIEKQKIRIEDLETKLGKFNNENID